MNPFLASLIGQLAQTLMPILLQAGAQGVALLEAQLASQLAANGLPHINTAAPVGVLPVTLPQSNIPASNP